MLTTVIHSWLLQFRRYANEVDAVANSNVNNIFGIIHALSTALTSHARAEGKTWPNVSLSNFDIRASEFEGLTGVEMIAFTPLVTAGARAGWEAYAQANQGWVEDDWSYRNESVDAGAISPRIFYDGPQAIPAESITFPLWQTGPVPYDASIINLNLFQHALFHDIMSDALDVKHKLMSGVVDVNFLLENIVPNYADDGHPRSVIFDPVVDDFVEGANATGFIVAELAWEYLLQDILPTGESFAEY